MHTWIKVQNALGPTILQSLEIPDYSKETELQNHPHSLFGNLKQCLRKYCP